MRFYFSSTFGGSGDGGTGCTHLRELISFAFGGYRPKINIEVVTHIKYTVQWLVKYIKGVTTACKEREAVKPGCNAYQGVDKLSVKPFRLHGLQSKRQ
jgi:hypothetical protein